jgi:lysophospholipase L1-like esterase
LFAEDLVEKNEKRELIYTRALFSISLLISIVLAVIVTINDLLFIKVLFGLALFTVVSLVVMNMLHSANKRLGLFLSLAILNIFLVVPELVLRVTGFRYEAGIQFGYPRPSQYIRLMPDPELFWRLNPSYPDVNSEGFQGDEFSIPKQTNVFRMLYLGDSTTVQGFPQEVEEILNHRLTQAALQYESVSLGVYGYSSHQGRILAQRYADLMEPDLVVVYYGWNDHWLAYGAKDSEKEVSSSSLTDLYVSLHQFRLAQGLFWLSDSISGAENIPIEEVRVPPEEYRDNLSAIRDEFLQYDVPIVFITAPTAHYQLGVPEYLIEMKFAHNEDKVISMHKAYNEIVRQIVQIEGTYLLDLEVMFDSTADDTLLHIFMEDGIHFTEEGVQEVAMRIADFIEAESLGIESPY